MEILVALGVLLIIGALLGGESAGESIRKGCVFFVLLAIILFVLAMFYGYVLVIAFNKEILATRIGDGVMTVAYPVGAAIIVISFITTLIYVSRANSEFEDLEMAIKDDVKDLL